MTVTAALAAFFQCRAALKDAERKHERLDEAVTDAAVTVEVARKLDERATADLWRALDGQ